MQTYLTILILGFVFASWAIATGGIGVLIGGVIAILLANEWRAWWQICDSKRENE